jgi:hypothetical protein
MTRQPAVAETTDSVVDPRLARTLWQWLALGIVALAVFPALRGSTAWLGWGPYWLVVAPLTALAMAYRHRLFGVRAQTADLDATLATAHRRRQRAARGQAQRTATPRRGRHLRVA